MSKLLVLFSLNLLNSYCVTFLSFMGSDLIRSPRLHIQQGISFNLRNEASVTIPTRILNALNLLT